MSSVNNITRASELLGECAAKLAEVCKLLIEENEANAIMLMMANGDVNGNRGPKIRDIVNALCIWKQHTYVEGIVYDETKGMTSEQKSQYFILKALEAFKNVK